MLTELGDPDKLAAGYTDRPLYLIGPRYYLDWWRLLKLLLWIVLAVRGVRRRARRRPSPVTAFGEIIGTVVGHADLASSCTWCSGRRSCSSIVERTGAEAPTPAREPMDRRPAAGAAPARRRLRRHDRLARLPRGRGRRDPLGPLRSASSAYVVRTTRLLSFLDPGLWPWWIAGLFVLMALEALLGVVVYLDGRWTSALAVVNASSRSPSPCRRSGCSRSGSCSTRSSSPTIIPDDRREGRTRSSTIAVRVRHRRRSPPGTSSTASSRPTAER